MSFLDIKEAGAIYVILCIKLKTPCWRGSYVQLYGAGFVSLFFFYFYLLLLLLFYKYIPFEVEIVFSIFESHTKNIGLFKIVNLLSELI